MTQIAKDKIYGKLLHKRSVVPGNVPTGTKLEFGEIAVNFNELEPFLSIRTSGTTSDTDYVKFPSQKELDKLENSINLQLDEIESEISGVSVTVSNNEKIVAAAITALNDRIDGMEENDGSFILTMDMLENQVESGDDYNRQISGNINGEILTELLKAKKVVFIDGSMNDTTTSITFIRSFEISNEDASRIQFLGKCDIDNETESSYVLTVYSNGEAQFVNHLKVDNPKLGLSTMHDVEFSDLEKEQFKANLGINDSVKPDWNATEGDSGYIENKPFEFIDKHENAFFYDAYYNPNYIIWDAPSACDSSAIQILDFDGNPKYIDLTNHANGSFDNMDNIFENSLSYEWIDGQLGIKIPQRILDYDDDMQAYVNDLRRYSTGGELVKIDGTYLPNTIIKTTPQTLSDTEKNQVKENLGISTPDWAVEYGTSRIANKTHSASFNRIEYDKENNICNYEVDESKDKLLLLWREKYFTVYKNIRLSIDIFDGEDRFIVDYNGSTVSITDSNGMLASEYTHMSISEINIPLEEIFIPETVIKTVPQTLNDADKNQALANLGLSDVVTVINNKAEKSEIPIIKGDVEYSAVLKGEYEGYSNKAISQTSMAVGAATIAGLKGWYYSAIDFTNNTITLSDKQPSVFLGHLSGGAWSSGTPNIKVGDKISIVNNSKYDYCGEVKSISNNKVTLKSALPFDKLDTGLISLNNPDDWSIYLPDNESAGIIDFGGGALSEGVNTKSTNIGSHAEGIQTHAYGQFSHTEGFKTEAGYAAHAEGRETEAIGTMSHAEGQSTLAIGSKSHAEGTQTETHANNSHAEGYKSVVKDGAGAHVEGYGSVIDFTESTKSSDIPSDANKEQSIGAHVEGVNNTGAGIAVHVEGKNNKANRTASHAEGFNTRAGVFEVPNENTTSTEGLFTHAEGNSTLARGSASHAEGAATQSLGRASHAEGRHSVAGGNYSHAEGFDTFAGDNGGNLLPSITNATKGYFTHAEGHNTLAEGNSSHAEGKGSKALGDCSHAEGYDTLAGGNYSHAEGYRTLAEQSYSHAEGNNSHAEGTESHAEGYRTLAEGTCSHAEGHFSHAAGYGSHAEGYYTIAYNKAEHASGIYNKSTQSSDELQATRFSIGIGTSDTDRKNAFEVKQNGDIYIEGVDGRIQDKLDKLVNITYEELKSLRDNSQLVPGRQYRIIDYVTTTTQSDTQSAGHQFDIIVIADDVNVLNENVRAIQREGDTYFTNSDLNAWELKYCLDNDTNRFAWADATNGKGVIYYMKDEWNNECPYDFKNIQFARWELSNPVGYRNDYDFDNWEDNWVEESTPFDSLKTGFYGTSSSNKVFYYVLGGEGEYNKYKVEYTISESPTYCYTFGKDTDYSMNGSNYGNVIKEYKNSNKIQLNNIVFLGEYCYYNSFGDSCSSNSFGNDCESNSFGNSCSYNSFGNSCSSNSFGKYCSYNSFGEYCSSNSFGNDCESNSFGNSCYSNSFGEYCYSNSFGNGCSYNSFGNNYYSNSFGNGCSSNSFGNDCESNSFGNSCSYNSFGNSCSSNSFGKYCYSNSFGNSCSSNSFGNSCSYNSFGEYCSYNSFGESKINLQSYYRYITFDNGNRYINLNCTSTTSSSKYFQNVRIGLGVNNTNTYKTINDSNVGQTYETCYKPANSQTITI